MKKDDDLFSDEFYEKLGRGCLQDIVFFCVFIVAILVAAFLIILIGSWVIYFVWPYLLMLFPPTL